VAHLIALSLMPQLTEATNSLAYAELFITLAILFRPGAPKLRLYQTDESDVYPSMDLFIVAPKADSKGCRVTVE
jgi:hypothetical protein